MHVPSQINDIATEVVTMLLCNSTVGNNKNSGGATNVANDKTGIVHVF